MGEVSCTSEEDGAELSSIPLIIEEASPPIPEEGFLLSTLDSVGGVLSQPVQLNNTNKTENKKHNIRFK